jgi:hypothetical protein
LQQSIDLKIRRQAVAQFLDRVWLRNHCQARHEARFHSIGFRPTSRIEDLQMRAQLDRRLCQFDAVQTEMRSAERIKGGPLSSR